ncbi:MAG: alpha-amylase family glycosyl hydrolase [Chryseolinea sp.]
MKKFLLSIFTCWCVNLCMAQVVTTNPVFPIADQPVTITVDVSGTSLSGYSWNGTTSPVWIWTWVSEGCASSCDAPTNVDPATSPAQDAAKCVRISTNPDKYQITFTPTVFFNKPASELKKIGIKLKTKNWTDNKQTDNDRIIVLNTGSLLVNFTSPSQSLIFKNQGDQINITANASSVSDMTLKIDGNIVSTVTGATSLNYVHTVTESSGSSDVVIEANNGSEIKQASFTYVVRSPTESLPRPSGVVDGINYDESHPTKVTLSLYAPYKSSVYVIGDFNSWTPQSAFQMKKDADHYWLEINGLTAGQEYAFQYLVDESIKVGDPYADKILDPSNDSYISASVYPDLKTYPTSASEIVTVLQTAQPQYSWQVNNFVKPSKRDLTIYELLIRDFDTERSYQNVIDKLDYLQELGINGIELMPIMEFSGNDSWGYNPIYYFAPDKAYGPKNKLKELIDKAHQKGIAVLLDMVLNQADYECPLVKMYWNGDKPAANSPWFNQQATHPFSVFFDFNHESQNTKDFVDRVTEYWIKEFRFDGFRFDLSKGFTQKYNTDVGLWSAYDASRIAILKRMANKIWSHTPDAYVILEHFADNTEEKELSDNGMMLWGNMNYSFSQTSIGASSGSDLSWSSFKSRGWSDSNLVTYMESHDEERVMYRNNQNGNSSSGYNIKNLHTGLDRVKATSTFLFLIPGPKMVWQFGELGYDVSINEGGRVGAKPVKWEYYDDTYRYALYQHFADVISLRKTYSIFKADDITFTDGGSLVKQFTLKNSPYTDTPQSTDEMNAQVAGNFNVTSKSVSINFSHTGTWYDYFLDGKPVIVNTIPYTMNLSAGEYKLFTDYPIKTPVTTVEESVVNEIKVYPNPVESILEVERENGPITALYLYTTQGMKVIPPRLSKSAWDVGNVAQGLYIAEVHSKEKTYRIKVIKK